MARLIDSGFNERRRLEALLNTKQEQSFKFTNKNGDLTVVTPQELKNALFNYIENEMMMYPELKSDKIKKDIEDRLTEKLQEIESQLMRHVDNKINKITQEIVSKTNKRYIDAEVEKQFNEKLEKLKNLL